MVVLRADRYFYHAFPRIGGDNPTEKGLKVLESIARSGLLLVPEFQPWQEPMDDWNLSSPVTNIQKRACFTYLVPSELQLHSKYYGSFALEFEYAAMVQLGGIPAVYLPPPSAADRGMENTAAAMVMRLGNTQQLLNRLADLESEIRDSPETTSGAETLLERLKDGFPPSISARILANNLRFLAGFLVTTNNPSDPVLQSYHEREWRIVGNLSKSGQEQTNVLTKKEKEILLDFDEESFSKEARYHTQFSRFVDQCLYFSELEGKSFLSYAGRVIVPDEAVGQANQILAGDGLPEVVPISDV